MMKIAPASPALFLPPGQIGLQSLESRQTSAQALDITIQTREGDVVTISGADFQDLAFSARPDRVNGEAVSAGFRSSSIQGDLSQQELADIRKLMDDLRSIAGHFFAGRFDQALSRAGRLGELGGSLASLEASFSRSLSFSHALSFQPVPDSFQEAVGGLARGLQLPTGRESPPDFERVLHGRWQQIRELLPDITPPAISPGGPFPRSAAEAARQLFQRTMTELPQLPKAAPLLPEIGQQAIRQATAFFSPDLQGSATRLQHELKDLFRSWLLAA